MAKNYWAREVSQVGGVFQAIPGAMNAFSAANQAAAAEITSAGSTDSESMLGAAASALGPIGAGYLAAYAPAQANNLAATLLVAQVHAAIGGATDASKATMIAADNA
jgi:hypothetical protein